MNLLKSNNKSGYGIKAKNIFIIPIVLFVFVFSIKLYAQQVKAEQNKVENQKAETVKTKSMPSEKYNVSNFVYTSDGKRDPFEPLYLLKMRQDKVASVAKRGYELEEMKLVGILKTNKMKYAMMEDMQGKGINFKKGDYLNKNLWIMDILDSKVVLGYRLKGEIKKIEIDIPKQRKG